MSVVYGEDFGGEVGHGLQDDRWHFDHVLELDGRGERFERGPYLGGTPDRSEVHFGFGAGRDHIRGQTTRHQSNRVEGSAQPGNRLATRACGVA